MCSTGVAWCIRAYIYGCHGLRMLLGASNSFSSLGRIAPRVGKCTINTPSQHTLSILPNTINTFYHTSSYATLSTDQLNLPYQPILDYPTERVGNEQGKDAGDVLSTASCRNLR